VDVDHYKNEQKEGMNGLGEIHSCSGIRSMNGSGENDSCLSLPQNPCKKAGKAGELLQSQENKHLGYNSILSVRNGGHLHV